MYLNACMHMKHSGVCSCYRHRMVLTEAMIDSISLCQPMQSSPLTTSLKATLWSLLNRAKDPFILDITEILVTQTSLQDVYPCTCAATVASMKTKIIETHKCIPESKKKKKSLWICNGIYTIFYGIFSSLISAPWNRHQAQSFSRGDACHHPGWGSKQMTNQSPLFGLNAGCMPGPPLLQGHRK